MKLRIGAARNSHDEKNGDRFELIKTNDFHAIIICDAIGSLRGSEDYASPFVSLELANIIRKSISNRIDRDFIRNAFQSVQESFCKKYEKFPKMGTTLLLVIEMETYFLIAYVGNGGIFHIKADFIEYNFESYLYPRNAINLLNPHIKLQSDGKFALTKLISNIPNKELCNPSIIRIDKEKDILNSGDLFMLCTDGIFSYEEVTSFKCLTPDDDFFAIKSNISLEIFFNDLKEVIQKNCLEDISVFLDRYLNKIKNPTSSLGEMKKTLMEDDCAIGLLISERAIDFFKGKQNENNNR